MEGSHGHFLPALSHRLARSPSLPSSRLQRSLVSWDTMCRSGSWIFSSWPRFSSSSSTASSTSTSTGVRRPTSPTIRWVDGEADGVCCIIIVVEESVGMGRGGTGR